MNIGFQGMSDIHPHSVPDYHNGTSNCIPYNSKSMSTMGIGVISRPSGGIDKRHLQKVGSGSFNGHAFDANEAPSVNPSLLDRRHAYAGDSMEQPAFHPGSLGNMGFSAIPQLKSLELASRNIFSPSSGNCLDPCLSPAHIRIPSPQQRGQMFHGRNPMFPIPGPFDGSTDRIRSRRNDTNVNQCDNKKQYELDIERIIHGKTLAFLQSFNGKKWEKFNSEKVASLAYARIQGKAALIAHFQNSSLMNEDKRCRPILFHTDGPNAGDQEPFPVGTNIRSRSRSRTVSGGEENHQGGLSAYANGEASCDAVGYPPASTKGSDRHKPLILGDADFGAKLEA
ncbi:hypothetical protein B296_00021054 [Ensete ventricosum]|uniref:Mei2-like C-terminal RNA recognition motif domain-containing protein n=1 Tax=Ensete ventricosum TaxID=4639 RepID=A0A427AM03_ENSVE|nr:hypothetical protein B296_00021054 [Ensete ventricosum]